MSRRLTQSPRTLLSWLPLGALAAATACTPGAPPPLTPVRDRARDDSSHIHLASEPPNALGGAIQLVGYGTAGQARHVAAELPPAAPPAVRRATPTAGSGERRSSAKGGRALLAAPAVPSASAAAPRPLADGEQAEPPVKLMCSIGNSKSPSYGPCDSNGAAR